MLLIIYFTFYRSFYSRELTFVISTKGHYRHNLTPPNVGDKGIGDFNSWNSTHLKLIMLCGNWTCKFVGFSKKLPKSKRVLSVVPFYKNLIPFDSYGPPVCFLRTRAFALNLPYISTLRTTAFFTSIYHIGSTSMVWFYLQISRELYLNRWRLKAELFASHLTHKMDHAFGNFSTIRLRISNSTIGNLPKLGPFF